MTSTWSHGLACDIFYLFITSSTISKKLQYDGGRSYKQIENVTGQTM